MEIDGDNQAFVAEIARQHGSRLQRFLASRLRSAASDAPDLMQEVYLRLLRIPQRESIRSPLSYAFTVAFHVLHQHKLKLAVRPDTVDPTELAAELDSLPDSDPAAQAETRDRIEQLERTLRELPRNVYAAFVLQRAFGCTVPEIAVQLGVSQGMVKKYLARAVAHCQAQKAAGK